MIARHYNVYHILVQWNTSSRREILELILAHACARAAGRYTPVPVRHSFRPLNYMVPSVRAKTITFYFFGNRVKASKL